MPIHYTGKSKRMVVYKHQRMGKRPPRGQRYRKKAKLFRAPRAGGRSLIIPMKIGYQFDLIGTGAAFLNFDTTVGLDNAPPAWFTRYEPIFEFVRVNKCRYEITCGYNIGQPGIGTHPSLFRLWSKKANSTAELPPTDITEWLNLQNAKRSVFSGTHNIVNYYFTPAFESRSQPLNAANTSLKLLYKEWQTIQTTPGAMTPNIGMIGCIVRLDGGPITNAMVFKVNVTLYCQVKGVKQL